jgi:hypothetical protein
MGLEAGLQLVKIFSLALNGGIKSMEGVMAPMSYGGLWAGGPLNLQHMLVRFKLLQYILLKLIPFRLLPDGLGCKDTHTRDFLFEVD